MSPAPPASAAVCALCGGQGKPWLHKRGYVLFMCSGCSNAFVNPESVPEDLESLYTSAYFEGGTSTGYPTYRADQALLSKNFRDRLDFIESVRPSGRRLLEVGCAYGFFLGAARERGFDVTGVELAADCVEHARRYSGAPVIAGSFLEVPLQGPYDVIAMFDVLEHVRDPVACLSRAHSLLSDTGMLVVETGDLSTPWARFLGKHWYFLDPPQHLFYFSGRGLQRLSASAGFRGPVTLRRLGRRVSVSNIAFKLLKAMPEAGARTSLVEVARRVPGSLYLNFGDGMLMAIRK